MEVNLAQNLEIEWNSMLMANGGGRARIFMRDIMFVTCSTSKELRQEHRSDGCPVCNPAPVVTSRHQGQEQGAEEKLAW